MQLQEQLKVVLWVAAYIQSHQGSIPHNLLPQSDTLTPHMSPHRMPHLHLDALKAYSRVLCCSRTVCRQA